MSSHNQYTKYGIVIFVGTVSVILFQICFINFISAKAVSLIPIKSDNVTLDRGLPKFYNCIEQAVKHSVKHTEGSCTLKPNLLRMKLSNVTIRF